MTDSDTQDNKKVVNALKSLVGVDDPPEIDEATFRAELSIEYPLIDESEAEARDWLTGLLEHHGEEITMTVEQLERSDNKQE